MRLSDRARLCVGEHALRTRVRPLGGRRTKRRWRRGLRSVGGQRLLERRGLQTRSLGHLRNVVSRARLCFKTKIRYSDLFLFLWGRGRVGETVRSERGAGGRGGGGGRIGGGGLGRWRRLLGKNVTKSLSSHAFRFLSLCCEGDN